jgi:hypothetical protein
VVDICGVECAEGKHFGTETSVAQKLSYSPEYSSFPRFWCRRQYAEVEKRWDDEGLDPRSGLAALPHGPALLTQWANL